MFIESFIVQVILILFPFLVYVLFLAYRNNSNLKSQKLFFYFSCWTSIYFILKYNEIFQNNVFILLVNIPLLVSYLKQEKGLSISISVVIALYYINHYNINPVIVSLEYLFYYIYMYFIIKKVNVLKVLNFFCFVKGLVLSFEIYFIFNRNFKLLISLLAIFAILITFYLISFVIIYLLRKGEEIVSLNHINKELEKEKTIQKSLFKLTHEIKNPIAVCKGYLDMMNYSDINKVKKYNQIIKSEIERTLTIMDDFIDYTKIKVNKELIDVTMLIDDVSMSFDGYLKSNRIVKKVSNLEDEIYIMADYNKLKQVILNLIKNAVEAIDQNGEINISLKAVKGKVIITISDNGIGMSEEDLSHIKEAFYTTKKNGTGLGVSLSNEIINLHNGSLSYDSLKNKGTKVTITLPKLKEV